MTALRPSGSFGIWSFAHGWIAGSPILGILGLQGGDTLQTTLVSIVELYLLVMIVYAVLTWFPLDPHSPFSRLRYALGRIVEPVVAPVRRLLPQTNLPIDLAFLIVFFGLQILVVPAIEHLT
jgi:YggT family protein